MEDASAWDLVARELPPWDLVTLQGVCRLTRDVACPLVRVLRPSALTHAGLCFGRGQRRRYPNLETLVLSGIEGGVRDSLLMAVADVYEEGRGEEGGPDTGTGAVRGMLTGGGRALVSLSLNGAEGFAGEGLAHVARIAGLTSLDLGWCYNGVTDVGLGALLPLANLTALDLRSCKRLTDRGVSSLSALRSLQVLCLSGVERLTGRGLEAMGPLPFLRDLDLSWCGNIGVEALPCLAAHPNLAKLSLAQNVRVATVAPLAACAALTSLDVGHNPGLRVVGDLWSLESLRVLIMPNCNCVPIDDMDDMQHAQSLTELDIGHCTRQPPIALPRPLRKLCVAGSLLNDADLNHIAGQRLPHLTSLDCTGCTSVRWERIDPALAEGLGTLATLNLNGCRGLGGYGLARLAELPKLQDLDISRCPRMTDGQVEVLARFPSLRRLAARELPLTNEGMAALGRCAGLTSLDVRRSVLVTPVGLAHLRWVPELIV